MMQDMIDEFIRNSNKNLKGVLAGYKIIVRDRFFLGLSHCGQQCKVFRKGNDVTDYECEKCKDYHTLYNSVVESLNTEYGQLLIFAMYRSLDARLTELEKDRKRSLLDDM